DSLLWRLYFI
ncbi:hypothetical protein D046_2723B, partial [Vibrio parahaemolyticus V-223/04]